MKMEKKSVLPVLTGLMMKMVPHCYDSAL